MMGAFDWAIDIETMGNEDLISKLPSPSIKSTLKDPAKIAAAIEEGTIKQIKEMGLSPLFGKIACICVMNGLGEKHSFIGEDEKDLLTRFYAWFYTKKEHRRLVTFSGKDFDLPFIYKRLAIHGIASLSGLKRYINRYSSDDHIDLKHEFFGLMPCKGKLDTLAEVVIGENKLDFDVMKISEFMKTENGRAMVDAYCQKDVEVTMNVAKKLGY